MGFKEFFSSQARKPSGLFGRFCMARLFDKGNAPLNDLAFETVDMGENERVLEIGCGPGTLIRRLADQVADARIEGIDFSEPMAAVARRKNKEHIRRGKVKILAGDFHDAPLDRDSYDKVISVNTVYFWKAPEATTAAIHRILKPGGRLIIGFHRKSDMLDMPLNPDVFRYYALQDMEALLYTAFPQESVEIVTREGPGKPCFCAVATKA